MPFEVNRRTVLKVLGGTIAGPSVWAHDLRPGDPTYHFQEYEDIVNRSAQVKQLFQWPNIANPIIFANVRNSLNGFQFSYDIPSDDIQIVVQAYATANPAVYDDSIWDRYRWGEALSVLDPATNQPATRNIFYNTPVSYTTLTPGRQPTDRNSPFF